MIADILAGLAILKVIDSSAPIVTAAYILAIPAIKTSMVIGTLTTTITDGQGGTETVVLTLPADLLALGWEVHPVYDCYYYPTDTITELKDVTGEGSLDPPPYPVPIQSSR